MTAKKTTTGSPDQGTAAKPTKPSASSEPTKPAASGKPAKRPASGKPARPAASSKPARPVDLTEIIEASLRAVGVGEGSGVLVETEGCALILVPVGDPPRLVLRRTTPQGEAYRITVQLFIYTALDGERIVRDIKEQEVFLGRPEDLADRERLVALWQGLRQALGKRLGTMSERAMAQVDILMPYDLLPLKRLLERRTFRTTEQFARAALGKSYLGRVLPEA